MIPKNFKVYCSTHEVYIPYCNEHRVFEFHNAVFISYQYDLEYQIYSVEVVKW